jgi:hypothetical protein
VREPLFLFLFLFLFHAFAAKRLQHGAGASFGAPLLS